MSYGVEVLCCWLGRRYVYCLHAAPLQRGLSKLPDLYLYL